MKYSNELKVGVTIVVATLIFIFGVRFFQDLPLFRGTYSLETELSNAAGLIAGNPVRVNGITVGSVDQVALNPQTNKIRVLFHVDSELPIPEGSQTQVSGFDALGVVRMDILLGAPGGARIPENGFLPSRPTSDLMETVTGKAPELLEQMQAVMTNLNQVLGESGGMLSDPDSDLRLTLLSARRSVDGIDNLLRTQRERIASVLANIDQASAGLGGFMESNKDSLAMAISAMNATMAQLDRTLAGVDVTSANLNQLLVKINEGQGTLGMLVNDDAMYQKTDSLLNSIQSLINDFQENPGRYLKELRLVDLF